MNFEPIGFSPERVLWAIKPQFAVDVWMKIDEIA